MNFSWIPWQLREGVHDLLRIPDRRRFRRIRNRLRRADGTEPLLGFGGVLDDGRLIHGGAVKLLPLRRAFAGRDDLCNLLYAVSSSPPRFCDDLLNQCADERIPLVWNQNGVAFPAWCGAESERLNAPMRRRRGRAVFVVYQSDFCRRSAERFLGSSSVPSEVLFNPVDLAVYRPAARHDHKNALRLLAAGTHATRERVLEPVQALMRLRRGGIDASLTIAGRFDWSRGEEEISAALMKAGATKFVRRVPRFSQNDAPDLYRAHDLLIHPKYMDPCPTVVIEAMACGLAVVASRSGGLPEMVPADAGRLVGADDDWEQAHPPTGAEIADAIGELAPRLSEHGAAARRYAEQNYDVTRWVQRHGAIFQSLLA